MDEMSGETRIYTNRDEVIVDYLKDIRDELRAMNRKLDTLTINQGGVPYPDSLSVRTFNTNGGGMMKIFTGICVLVGLGFMFLSVYQKYTIHSTAEATYCIGLACYMVLNGLLAAHSFHQRKDGTKQ
jgi:hypothetical protein